MLPITGHIKNMDHSKNLCHCHAQSSRVIPLLSNSKTSAAALTPFHSWAFQTQQESLHSCTDLCLLSNISNPISVLCPSPHPEICGSGGSKASKLSRCFPSKLLYGLTKTRSADMTPQLDESKSFLQG